MHAGPQLLVQVVRHFHRSDAVWKVGETFIGGLIVAATVAFLSPIFSNSNPFAIFMLPLAVIGIPIIMFGLYLIWRKELWLARFRTAT